MACSVNFHEICRFCLSPSPNLINIFTQEEENVPLSVKIAACTSIVVIKDDLLPQNICNTCQFFLNMCFKFREVCTNGDNLLRKYLKYGFFEVHEYSEIIKKNQIQLKAFLHKETVVPTAFGNDIKKGSGISSFSLGFWEKKKEKNGPTNGPMVSRSSLPFKMFDIYHPSTTADCNVAENKPSALAESHTESPSAESETSSSNEELINIFSDFTQRDGNSEGQVGSSEFSSIAMELECQSTGKVFAELPVGKMCTECNSYFASDEEFVDHNLSAHPETASINCDQWITRDLSENFKVPNHVSQGLNESMVPSSPMFHSNEPDILELLGLTEISEDSKTELHSSEFFEPIDDIPFKNVPKKPRIVATKPKKKFIECDECGITFTQNSDFKRHSLNLHGRSKESTKKQLQENLIFHETQEETVCHECGKILSSSFSLLNHMNVKHGRPFGKKQKCELCNYECNDAFTLKNHVQTHAGEKPFVCKDCGSAFTHKSNLMRHCDMKHSKDLVVCEECGGQFSKAMIKLHAIRHQPSIVPCSHCTKTFQTRERLRVHRIRAHKLMPYPCPFCPSGFTSGGNLKQHVSSVHSDLENCEFTQEKV